MCTWKEIIVCGNWNETILYGFFYMSKFLLVFFCCCFLFGFGICCGWRRKQTSLHLNPVSFQAMRHIFEFQALFQFLPFVFFPSHKLLASIERHNIQKILFLIYRKLNAQNLILTAERIMIKYQKHTKYLFLLLQLQKIN